MGYVQILNLILKSMGSYKRPLSRGMTWPFVLVEKLTMAALWRKDYRSAVRVTWKTPYEIYAKLR